MVLSTLHNECIGIVRLWMPMREFETQLSDALAKDPRTISVERSAVRLILDDFPVDSTVSFVKAVCEWGNYAGVAGRVFKHNDHQLIADSMRSASGCTKDGDISGALNALIKLHSLGVSFASKHLRFLDPAQHVVLDSIISQRLGFPMTIDGYLEFLAECAWIREKLGSAGIRCPADAAGKWRVADVELAIYNKLTEPKI